MSILDIKRNKEDFLKHKSKSSPNTLVNYTFIFKSIEKFCIQKYNSSLENIIEELAVVDDPQEQVESMLQNYIDELELEDVLHTYILHLTYYIDFFENSLR